MQYYRTIERNFVAGDAAALVIANRRGELTVIGEDREDIAVVIQLSVNADGERDGERALDAIRLPIEQAGDEVRVGPPEFDEADSGSLLEVFGIRLGVGMHGGGTRVDMNVRVPRRCRVRVEHRSGPTRVNGLRNGLRVFSRSGRTEVADIEGDVEVEARSGGLQLRDVRGDVRVSVRSGRAELEQIRGNVQLSTSSGGASVRDVEGGLTAEGRSGRLRAEQITGAMNLSFRSGGIEYRGRIAQPVDIDVASGGVRLAVTRDSAFFLDAETRSGGISSDLPVGYLEKPPSGAATVRVRVRSGGIKITTA